ncbi:hypothetical protein [Nocardioides sp.]|uniref:hypothetical protein n=1 Tax=Nocardioides sp. TaxID=35761 RepID=UPI002CD4D156|nr:hypothetical protein [Nocardioides sp.]HSX66170.1 hypothetical protein [Nocardioides sp.]
MVSIESLGWRFHQVRFVLMGAVFITYGVWQLATRPDSALEALSTLGLGLIGLGLVFRQRLVAIPAAHAAFTVASGAVMTLCSLAIAVGAISTLEGFAQTAAWAGVVLIPIGTAAWLVQWMRMSVTPESGRRLERVPQPGPDAAQAGPAQQPAAYT